MRAKQYKMLFYNNIFLYNLNVTTQLERKNRLNYDKMEFLLKHKKEPGIRILFMFHF